MSADTPRTDAAILGYELEPDDNKAWTILVDSARQLERELWAAREDARIRGEERAELERMVVEAKEQLPALDEENHRLKLRVETAEAQNFVRGHKFWDAKCQTDGCQTLVLQARIAELEKDIGDYVASSQESLGAKLFDERQTRRQAERELAEAQGKLAVLCDQALAALRMVPSERVLRMAKQIAEMGGGSIAVGDAAELARELLRIKGIAKGKEEGNG